VPLDPQVATPTAGDPPAVVPLAWPLPDGCAEAWGAIGAGDAPILFAMQAVPQDGSLRPGPRGHVLALRYPRPAAGYDHAPELLSLGAARLPDVPLVRLPRARCAGPGPSCGLGVVDPDGRALSVGGGLGCHLWRWAVGADEAECVVPGDAPAWAAPGNLVAAISPTHYIYRDG